MVWLGLCCFGLNYACDWIIFLTTSFSKKLFLLRCVLWINKFLILLLWLEKIYFNIGLSLTLWKYREFSILFCWTKVQFLIFNRCCFAQLLHRFNFFWRWAIFGLVSNLSPWIFKPLTCFIISHSFKYVHEHFSLLV